MPSNEIIVNGNFSQGNLGWTGTDLETNYTENAYLGNGSTNNVAEMDGNRGQITVMEQTITVASGLTTSFTFRTALRTGSLQQAGVEGFRIQILDADGNSLIDQTITPTSTTWTAYSLPVTFPAGGNYTVRFTEVGPDDSFGAIIDDVSMLVCFGAGTRIQTETGQVPAGRLAPGDRVWTQDAGFQPIRWIASRKVGPAEMRADQALRPVRLAPGALGPGQPERPLFLSPQHRLCLSGWKCELHFGAPEVLVPALSLVNGTTVRRVAPRQGMTYVHFLLDRHHLVRSEGVISESFFPSALALRGVDAAARAELLRLFPRASIPDDRFTATARPVVRGSAATLAA